MDIINLLLTFSILYMLYVVFIQKKPWCNNEFFSNTEYIKEKNNKKLYNMSNDEYLDDVIQKSYKKEKKFTFNDNQFHKDYRDVITIVNNLTSYQNIFNKSDKPLNVIQPNENKIKKLAKYLIHAINENSKTITDTLKINSGWDEMISRKNVKSGWDKQMEKLGLPSSIYSTDAKKGKVKLIKIQEFEGFEIDDEILITCVLIIQKKNVQDKMLLKVNFWIDKCTTNDDRYFFNDTKNEQKLDIVIEKIDILGYFTDINDYNKTSRDNFYNFTSINEEKGTMMDQNEVMNELSHKYKERSKRINESFNKLNEEDKQKYVELSDKYN